MNRPQSTDDATELEQGYLLLTAGQHQAALAIANRLIESGKVTADTLFFASDVHYSRADFFESERLGRECADRFPDNPAGDVLRTRALIALGRNAEARQLALETAERELTDDRHIQVLVTALSNSMMPDAAYSLCKKAVENDPQNPAAHRRLALNCRLIGKFDEAIEAANVALEYDPHDYEMIGLRSSLRTATTKNNNIQQLESLLASGCRNARGAARVAYSLAKECEDVGLYEQAFKYLNAGARFKRQTMKYDVSEDLRTFQTMEEVFTADSIEKAATNRGFETREPIFVLGLPRTGSTLIERILSSHSAIYSAGELGHFSTAMMEEIRRLGALQDRADLIRKSMEIDFQATGRRYVELTRPATGHTPHFIDKLPLNSLSIGVIALALPNAPIILTHRTPLDACYAIYKFLFNEVYAWSYDLDDLAKFYIGYRRLMEHWKSVFPERIIEVVYEDVVEDLEGVARRLIDQLGLDWESACLEFHRNKAAAMTGSAVQVRQKIYTSSVGRWRNYENQLRPLADALQAAGIDPFQP